MYVLMRFWGKMAQSISVPACGFISMATKETQLGWHGGYGGHGGYDR